MCEPDPGIESIVMAHAPVNSAPVIAGAANPGERRHLARYVYRMSRGLIGERTAESLRYPDVSAFGAVEWFRLQMRFGRVLDKVLPGHRQKSSFSRFGYLLAGSTYDKDGINFRLPTHVYGERAGEW